jgi:uncharacterized phage protein gp47/JayE
MSEIDPVKFGLLIGQVKTLETQVEDLQKDVKQLLELANKSKGSLWAGMTIASMFGGIVSWIATHMGGK